MRLPHTVLSRVAVLAVCLVAVALARLGAAGADLPYLVVPVTAAAVTAVGSAYKMARDNCFESRLVAAVVSAACLVATVASWTVGLPGREAAVHPTGVVLAAGALLLLVVVAVELPRRHASLRVPSPYAP